MAQPATPVPGHRFDPISPQPRAAHEPTKHHGYAADGRRAHREGHTNMNEKPKPQPKPEPNTAKPNETAKQALQQSMDRRW